MRGTRCLMLIFASAMAAGGCARQPVMRVQMAAAPAPYGIDNVVYGSSYGAAATPSYATPAYSRPTYATAPVATYAAAPAAPYARVPVATYAAAPAPSYAMAPAAAYAQAPRPLYSVAAPAAPTYAMAGGYAGGTMVSPAAYSATTMQWPYMLDSGDRLRVVVFGQDGLTNSYMVDASGQIDMPLIGIVPARGLTTDQLSARIADMLRQGFVREPHVAVEVEAYRPFFILGEVAQPGQYPYTPNMTVETAVAIAGGFGPRGEHDAVLISRNYGGQVYRFRTPITAPVRPGDTIQVQERWF